MMRPTCGLPFSESETIALFQKGNKEAFGHLYDCYSPLLFGLVNRITSNNELAEKVLADTFVQISNNRFSYNEKKEGIFSWMIKCARATALSAVENKKEITESGSETDSDLELNHFVSSESYESEEKVLELMYIYGKTSQELCNRFNADPEIIRAKLKCALNRLKVKEVV
jgi:DNA-directed RNA polymerase specialized sigma24 family protein